MHISRILPTILIVTLLFSIVNAFVSINSLQRYQQDEQLVTQTYQTRHAIERLFLDITDDETSVRGYIITSQQQFLTDYVNYQKNTSAQLTDVKNLTHDNAPQKKNVQQLEALIAQRIAALNQAITLNDSQGFSASQSFIQQGTGVAIMTNIRNLVENMITLQNNQLTQQITDAAQSLQRTYTTIILANLLGLLLIGVSYYFFIRELQTRTVLEQRKNDFISMASHELKTPLTSMNAFVYALKKHIKNAQAQRWINKLESQVKNQTKMINELLDNSRMQEGRLSFAIEPCEMNAIIADIVETMQATVKHKIVIKGKAKKPVACDSERIGQVVTNLLSNAVKYSPEAKKVIVSIENMQRGIKVHVQDFGIGIPKKDLENVFNRFYRVEHDKTKRFPGLGLGLYISAEIIKRHHGTLSVKSSIGKGSVFSFTLPYARKNANRTI